MKRRIRVLLKQVRAKLDQGWCQDTFARTISGISANPKDESAAAFCMIGAIQAVTGNAKELNAVRNVLKNNLPKKKGHRSIVGFNDHQSTTKRRVLNVVDRAIRSTEVVK